MEFQRDCQKDKNYSSFKFLAENLEKFRLTELYGAALEGLTIFLQPNSTSRTPLDSAQLGELKYAFFSGTGRKTEKLQRSNLFPDRRINTFYTATQAIHGWKALD